MSWGPTPRSPGPREAGEHGSGVGELGAQPDLEAPFEQLGAQLVWTAHQAHRRVEDGDTVTEPLGLLEAVRGQKDGDAAVLERGDELVDLSGGDRVEPRSGLVQEQHRRVVEQRPGQGHSLAEPLGESSAEIVGPLGQVDRWRARSMRVARVGQLVELGKALKVLRDREAEVEARGLGHNRDQGPDGRAVRGVQLDARHRRGA